MNVAGCIERLISRENLLPEEASGLMRSMLNGELSDAQLGGALVALRMKGVTGIELAAFAQELRADAVPIPNMPDELVDTCGTGGGTASFNLSTGAAIVTAAAGVPVAKHGNRAVTSTCGSADVLEALGVRLADSPQQAFEQFQETGLCFLYAPHFHPGMKAVGPARKALGVRTVFNMLGPLVNPARAKRQLIGVYHTSLIEPMADALERLGGTGMIVTGMDGLDEVSPTTATYAHTVDPKRELFTRLTPEDFEIECLANLVPGDSPTINADILASALRGTSPERTEALIPNAAVTFWLAGKVDDLASGARMARETVRSGAAWDKLQHWIQVSQR